MLAYHMVESQQAVCGTVLQAYAGRLSKATFHCLCNVPEDLPSIQAGTNLWTPAKRLAGPFHESTRPSQSIPQAPRNSSDAAAEQREMRARTHTHTHTHTPKGHLALFSLSRGSKGWSETGRSEGNAIRTAQPRQTLFAFSSSLPSASKVPSASALQDISLNRISSGSQLPASALRATSKLRAQIPGGTDLALACASSASMP